jgi:PEP-CTERM motif
MKNPTRIWILLAAATILTFAPSAFGQSSLTLNNPGNNVMGGVYVGPYNFTLTSGGQSQQIQLICDDAASEVFAGESWNVTTATFPTLTNIKFPSGSQTQNYEEIAWLVQQMYVNIGNAHTVGDIQWAIWDIFDGGVSSNDPWGAVSSTDQANIQNWLTQAGLSSNYSTGNYANIVIYTPVPGTQPKQFGSPQEYFGLSTGTIATPEPGTLAMLGIGLFALGSLGRRKVGIGRTL